MTTEYSVCANCSRVLFVVMNILFVIFGSGLIGFGSYLINLGSEHDYDVITGSQFVTGAALLVAAGIFTFGVAVIGIVGAAFMWRPMLVLYVLVILFLVIAEIAAGIVGFVFRDTITEDIEERMNRAFDLYTEGPQDENYMEDVNDVVAYVQETFECCGVNGSDDWLEGHPDIFISNGNLPPRECLCNLEDDEHCEMVEVNRTAAEVEGSEVDLMTTYNAWDRGCLELVEDNLDNIAIGIGVLGIAVSFFEIIGILVAVGLIVCIFKARKNTVV